MDRRKFLTMLLSAGAITVASYGCSIGFNNNKEVIGKEFIYKNENELPKTVRLDLCTNCQLQCPACYMQIPFERDQVGIGYITFEQFKDFVDKHPFIEEIETSKSGEIFLNPDIIKIMKYAYEKGIKLTAHGGANLNYLTDEMAEALVKYKFKILVVSIDGASQETYKIYRVGGNYNTVINNVKKINHYKKLHNSESPHLVYKFILFGHTEHEIEKVKELSKELEMDYEYSLNYADNYSPIKNPQKVYEQTGMIVRSHAREWDHWNGYINEGKNANFICHALWEQPVINWNGELIGCCYNKESFKINVFKDGLLKAMNNEKVLYTRKMLTDLNTPIRKDIPCSRCYSFNWMRKNNLKLEKNIYT